MKRIAILMLLLLTGCSTNPVAGFLDWVAPGRPPKGDQYYGGVGNPNPDPAPHPVVVPGGPGIPPPPPPGSPTFPPVPQ